ncbi:MAG: PAS domain-containing sensor histidine kinase [Chloroflexota bacterium]
MPTVTVNTATARRLEALASNHGLTVENFLDQYFNDDSPVTPYSQSMALRDRALAAVTSGIIIVDVKRADMPAIYVNPAVERLTGYAPEEIIGRNCRFLYGADTDQPGLQEMRQALENQQECTVVLQNYRKDGSRFWNELKLAPVFDTEGHLTHYIGVQDDITERIATEKALRESEARYRLLAEISIDFAFWLTAYEDNSFCMRWVTETLTTVTGYTLEDINAMGLKILHPDDRQQALNTINQLRERPQSSTLTCRVFTRSGELHVLELDMHSFINSSSPQIYGSARNITRQAQAEEALRESEKRYRIVSGLSFDFAFALRIKSDRSLTCEWMTDAFQHVTGYSVDELESMGGIRALIHPDDLPADLHILDYLINQESEPYIRYRITTRSGVVRHIQSKYLFERDSSDTILRIYSIARDVTDEYMGNIALRESEERFQRLVASLDDVIYTLDQDMRYTALHGGWVTHYGLSEEYFLGKTQRETFGGDADVHEDANRRALNGQTAVYQWHMNGADGRVAYFQTTVSPLRDGYGSITGVVGVGRDITELKRLEAEHLENERLRIELEKERELIDLKERFISMVSHEFRTPLSVIMSSANILEMSVDRFDRERFLRHVHTIKPQVKKMTRLLDDVLTLNKTQAGMMSYEPTSINIIDRLHCLLDDLRQVDEGRHPLSLALHALPAIMFTDWRLLEHILTNLISNALKYSPTGQPVEVDVCGTCQPGCMVIEVMDRGIGIPQEDRKRLFSPFHRASNADGIPGSGLGLSIVKSSAEALGGSVKAEPRAEGGMKFTVVLPLEPIAQLA